MDITYSYDGKRFIAEIDKPLTVKQARRVAHDLFACRVWIHEFADLVREGWVTPHPHAPDTYRDQVDKLMHGVNFLPPPISISESLMRELNDVGA